MPVAMTKDVSTYYLTYDQVGSLRVVADASGNVVKTIEYDSFGNIINDTDLTFEVPFGFAGGLHDRDTGLVRFGYRDYDPDMGRWTAKDPILFHGADTDLYGYCLNDPVNFTDPSGLDRYKPCEGLEGVALAVCKKYVDAGCEGEKNIICCESEKMECFDKIEWECPNADAEFEKCMNDFRTCMAGTKLE